MLKWLICLGVLTLVALPARADLPGRWVFLDYLNLELSFEKGAGAPGSIGRLTIQESSDPDEPSYMKASVKNAAGLPVASTGLMSLPPLHLSLQGDVFASSSGAFSLVGAFTQTDVTGTKLAADFTSTYVGFGQPVGAQDGLVISGLLSTMAGNRSILVNADASDTWTFYGPTRSISILHAADYDMGTVWEFHSDQGALYADIEEFFAADRLVGDGDMKVNILPVPPAVALGAIGLGLVGWMKRRSA